jgi:beta-glucanase (GH16 family)
MSGNEIINTVNNNSRSIIATLLLLVIGLLVINVPTASSCATGTVWDGSRCTNDPVTPVITPTVTSTPTTSKWTLLCGEEFNGPIDQTKWKVYNNYDQDGATSNTRFMSSMTTVSNGQLHLGIAMNPSTGRKYIGGGLDNEPNTKCSGLTQGRWEVRAKMPKGFGTDGYIGLYRLDGVWPPEILLAETYGGNPTTNWLIQIYNRPVQYDTTKVTGDWSSDFHIYAFEWEGDKLTWYIDGQVKKTSTWKTSEVSKMKIGMGAWSGTCGSTWPDCASASTLPAYMDIDYIRIYSSQLIALPPTPIVTQTPVTTSNLVSNSAFTTSLYPWVFYGSGSAKIVNGEYSMQITGTNIANQVYQTPINLKANKKYRLKFDIYSSNPQYVTVRLIKHVSPFTVYMPDHGFTPTGTKTTHSVDFVTPSTTMSDGRLMFSLRTATDGSTYTIDNVVLQEVV